MIMPSIGQKGPVATPIWLIGQQCLPMLSGLKPRTEPRLRLGSGALRLVLAARPHARRAVTLALGAASHRALCLTIAILALRQKQVVERGAGEVLRYTQWLTRRIRAEGAAWFGAKAPKSSGMGKPFSFCLSHVFLIQ